MRIKNEVANATLAVLLLIALSMQAQAQATTTACAGRNLPTFQDHPATTTHYDGKAHAPVLATALDRKFRTMIRTAASHGPNFAGHFSVVHWGLGTGVKGFVIVDLKTGIVYDPPFEGVGLDLRRQGEVPWVPPPEWQCYEDLLNYHPDSTLLVVEGCLLGGSQRCGRTYFVMENAKLDQLAYDADR